MKSLSAHRQAMRQFRAEEFYLSAEPDAWLIEIVIPRVSAIVVMALAAGIVLAIGAVFGWLDRIFKVGM